MAMASTMISTGQTAAQTLKARTACTANQSAKEPLQAAGTLIHIAESREIFAQGEESDTFYKVVSGVVRVCKFLNDGRRQIEAFHVAGEVFGFETGGERALSAEAVNDCTLISYRRRNVERLANHDETVSHQLLQFAMHNLAQAQDHSLLLGRRGAAEKVASFILGWAERCNGEGVVYLAMARQDIADYLGLTIETVSRSLSQFERDGVIALPSARQLKVLNADALEDLAA
jgi:CRP/FNR family transcriptional regulator, nitrogen fixation regulation protein